MRRTVLFINRAIGRLFISTMFGSPVDKEKLPVRLLTSITVLFLIIAGSPLADINTQAANAQSNPYASATVLVWNRTFGGTGPDQAGSVQQTLDGGYILAGLRRSYSGVDDGWLIKTDRNGSEQWNKTFGGTSWDQFWSVQQTLDGGYILAGLTDSYGAGSYDGWLVKADASGNEQWNRTFGGTGEDRTMSVQQTSDGGYILAGSTTSYGAGSYDGWLIKTDRNGSEQWNKTFGGTNWDMFWSVQQTLDGGYILAGETRSYSGVDNGWLVKMDANGNEQWNKTFSGNNAISAQLTSDGGYIVTGSKSEANNYDAWLGKADANGNEQWNRTFGGTLDDATRSVQQTPDGGYILAGFTASYGVGNPDGWLIKTDRNGSEQWNETFGGTISSEFNSVRQTSDGDYILAGFTFSYGAGSSDAWLIKVSRV